MKIKPLLDNVVVKFTNQEDTTMSGIVLTNSTKEKPQIAEVIAVGPGGKVNGEDVKMSVRVGDKIIAAKYSATEINIDGAQYYIMHHNDILAIVE